MRSAISVKHPRNAKTRSAVPPAHHPSEWALLE